jgi:tripartite-type tricarboxylate transporter receptor subunit TctC
MMAVGLPVTPPRVARWMWASSGAKGFLPLKEKIKPHAMYAAEAPDWWPDAPLISSAGIQQDFVEGSQRGWAVATKLKEEQPEIYAKLAGAIERASKNPEAIEALKKQDSPRPGMVPRASQEAYLSQRGEMEKHVTLLKGE